MSLSRARERGRNAQNNMKKNMIKQHVLNRQEVEAVLAKPLADITFEEYNACSDSIGKTCTEKEFAALRRRMKNQHHVKEVVSLMRLEGSRAGEHLTKFSPELRAKWTALGDLDKIEAWSEISYTDDATSEGHATFMNTVKFVHANVVRDILDMYGQKLPGA